MESPMAPSHFTLSDLKRSKTGHSDFEAVYLIKELNLAIFTIKCN